MEVLYIAPLPPPVTGHSLISLALKEELNKRGIKVNLVNLSKDSFKQGVSGFGRILEVFKILRHVWRNRKKADMIYFTISESLAGNFKDLFIYCILYRRLSRCVIHLHGGSLNRELFEVYSLLRKINHFFLRRLGGAIVTGESHLSIFKGILPDERIYIAPNFAADDLFVNNEVIIEKFTNLRPLRILYMSNLLPRKGYMDLLDGYLLLDELTKKQVTIDFTGTFETPEAERQFKEKAATCESLTYHGNVFGNKKKEFFSKAHVFCLPTSYLEGQPVSILEAYASGCVVVTTGQPGILDVFSEGSNGLLVEPGSPESITAAVGTLLKTKPEELQEIALANWKKAQLEYRRSKFGENVAGIIRQVLTSN